MFTDNQKEYYNELHLVPTIDDLDTRTKFDFIIIDGKDESLPRLKELIGNNCLIFIEGDRANQVLTIKQMFPKSKEVRVISTFKDPLYGPFDSNHWSGGATLIYLNPTSKQVVHCYVEKIKTFVKYKIRAF